MIFSALQIGAPWNREFHGFLVRVLQVHQVDVPLVAVVLFIANRDRGAPREGAADLIVHGRVKTSGSVIVIAHLMVFESTMVKRSTMTAFGP